MVKKVVNPAPFYNGLNSSRNQGFIFLVLDSRSPIRSRTSFTGMTEKVRRQRASFQRAKVLQDF